MKILKTQKWFGLFSPVWILAMILATILAWVGLENSAGAQDEFKYGSLMPVTGPIPQYGEYFIRGSQLALEELEKGGWIGGKKIRVILEDSKADPKIALVAMNKLINIDKVPIVESLVTPVLMAAGPIAMQN